MVIAVVYSKVIGALSWEVSDLGLDSFKLHKTKMTIVLYLRKIIQILRSFIQGGQYHPLMFFIRNGFWCFLMFSNGCCILYRAHSFQLYHRYALVTTTRLVPGCSILTKRRQFWTCLEVWFQVPKDFFLVKILEVMWDFRGCPLGVSQQH